MHRLLLSLLLLLPACSPPSGNGPGEAPAIRAFRADPATIAAGESSTLTWQATRATTLSLTPGIGPVTGTSHTVRPTTTTAYTLTAQNGAGTATAQTTVTVTGDGSDPDPLHDTIAYVREDGDAIRLVNPDGTDDRPLWAHGLDDPESVYDVWSLSWSPDATELAFASTHENWCSLYHADLFAVGADGTGYRRVTQAPACADLAAYPTGTVRVPVRNASFESFSGFLYFQGAPGLQPVNLPPNGTTTVTFDTVADFGSGEDGLQLATVIVAGYRELLFSTVVDVEAGGTVTTGEAGVFTPAASWEVRSPTWSPDGERIGHVLNFGSLWQLPRDPEPLAFGSDLLAEGATTLDFASQLAWGPTAATADQLLVAGSDFDATGIYLVTEGGAGVGEPLLAFASFESVLGLAWLPDASGFVFSVTEGDYFGEDRSANLFVYDLAAEEATRVTSLVGDFTGEVSVSPGGDRFAFTRGAEYDPLTGAMPEPEVWLVDRDGGNLALLVENAYAPAWSP